MNMIYSEKLPDNYDCRAEMQAWAEIAIEAEFDKAPLPPLDFEIAAALDFDMFEEPANEIWNRR